MAIFISKDFRFLARGALGKRRLHARLIVTMAHVFQYPHSESADNVIDFHWLDFAQCFDVMAKGPVGILPFIKPLTLDME